MRKKEKNVRSERVLFVAWGGSGRPADPGEGEQVSQTLRGNHETTDVVAWREKTTDGDIHQKKLSSKGEERNMRGRGSRGLSPGRERGRESSGKEKRRGVSLNTQRNDHRAKTGLQVDFIGRGKMRIQKKRAAPKPQEEGKKVKNGSYGGDCGEFWSSGEGGGD